MAGSQSVASLLLGSGGMFELEQAVREWKERNETREAYKPEDIEELEQHIYDGVEDLLQTGLSEEEAFLVVLHRMGKPQELAEEFETVNKGEFFRKRFLMAAAGMLGLYSLFSIITVISYSILLLGVFFEFEIKAAFFANSAFHMLFIGLVVSYFFMRENQGIDSYIVEWEAFVHKVTNNLWIGILFISAFGFSQLSKYTLHPYVIEKIPHNTLCLVQQGLMTFQFCVFILILLGVLSKK